MVQYWTHIPSRRKVDKLHTNIGHAKNAVNGIFSGGRGYAYRGEDIVVYKMVDGSWEEIYRVTAGDVELPWKRGEIAERERKAAEELERKRVTLEKEIKSLAQQAWAELHPQGYVITQGFEDYCEAYRAGYMAAREVIQ